MPPLKTTRPDAKIPPGSICIYGPTGVGKTTLLGTMPGRGLIIDVPQVEGGKFVLADKADRIEIYTCTSWAQVDEVYWAVRKGEQKCDWVAFDTITAMQELAKRKVVGDRDPNFQEDPHKVTLPEWGIIGQMIAQLVFNFLTLEKWVFWVAQERLGGSQDDPGPRRIGPDLTRSSLQALKPPMMIMARLDVILGDNDEEIRTLRLKQNAMYLAKCRALPGRKIDPMIRNPHMGNLLKYLLADGKPPRRFNELTAAFSMVAD